MTLQEIGDENGTGKERTRQVEGRALQKLRAYAQRDTTMGKALRLINLRNE